MKQYDIDGYQHSNVTVLFIVLTIGVTQLIVNYYLMELIHRL